MKQILKKYVGLTLSIFAAFALAILFFFMIYKSKEFSKSFGYIINIFTPFIYGAVLAYLLTPLCNICETALLREFIPHFKNKKTAESIVSKLAVLITFLLAAFVIYIFCLIVIPQLVVSISTIAEAMPGWVKHVMNETETFLLNNPQINEPLINISNTLYDKVQGFLDKPNILSNIQTIITQFSTGVFSFVGLLKNMIIGIIAAVYIIASRKKFRAQAKKLIYGIFSTNHANAVINELRFTDNVFSSFINGRILDSAIIGVLAFICLTFMKMPYVVLLSVVIGVTNVIPFFGPFIGSIPCFIIVLMVDPIKSLYFLVFVIILQQFDGNILGPKILGSKTGLSGFWVFFSTLFFGGLMGFVGMIIGVPVFAVIYDVASKIINARLRAKKLPVSTQSYLNLEAVENNEIKKHE